MVIVLIIVVDLPVCLSLSLQSITIEDEELASLVEQILKDDDLNDDGYVDYYEFLQAQRKTGSPPGAL